MTSISEKPDGKPSQQADRVGIPTLFANFLRLGVTAFGGPAMVAYIRELAVTRRRWLTAQVFDSGVALCQSVPGATAMQSAAYVGMKVRGPLGALACFVGFGLPAFVLMLALAALYRYGIQLWPVLAAMRGLSIIVVAIIASAAWTFGRSSVRNWSDAVLAGAAGVFLICGGSPIIAIAASGALSLVIYRKQPMPAPNIEEPSAGGGRRAIVIASIVLFVLAGALAAMWWLDRALFDLATLMLKVDIFAFGGGFASVPLMMHEVVKVRGWLSEQTFMHGIALGQVTPGPISITSTFVGYLFRDLAGAIVATVCMYTPSFLMVLVATPYFDRLQKSVIFRRAVRGVLASFVGLLLAVTAAFAAAVPWSVFAVILFAGAFAAFRFKVDIMLVVLAGVGISILLTVLKAW